MSGSGTVGTTGLSSAGTTTSGPFQPYTVLAAAALNSALQYGIKLGGTIDNTPIGQTTPAAGSFTTLTAVTPAGGDSSNNVATTAFVATAVGSGGGGGGGGSATTAITQAPGNSSTLIATTAFVGNAVATAVDNDIVGSIYTGSGSSAGLLRDDGTGVPTTLTSFLWSPINFVPVTNSVVLYIISTACIIQGFHIESPGATTGNNFAMTITRNGTAIGGTYTGSGTSTATVAISPFITCAAGDRILFTVGAITGTVTSGLVMPVGPLA